MNLRLLKSLMHRPPEKRLCFVHIPKTAGKSVARALHHAFFDPFHPASHFRFLLDALGTREAAEMLNRNVMDLRNDLLAYALCVEKNRLITGHFYLPESVAERFRTRLNFATMLRNPIERWISCYFYNLNKPHRDRISCSLDEYLESEAGRFGCNVYTGAFGGVGREIDTPDFDLARRAVENLMALDVLGFVEEISDFETTFKRAVGVPIAIPWLNKNPAAKSKYNVTSQQRVRIEKLCEADMWLFEEVKRRHHARGTAAS